MGQWFASARLRLRMSGAPQPDFKSNGSRPPESLGEKTLRRVLGKPRDVKDPHALHKLYPKDWETEKLMRLLGNKTVLQQIEADKDVPEILAADLSSFALDLAHWGVADASTLAFLDPPPRAALSEAKALLSELGAIDGDGRITEEGQRLRRLPLPPRLARMVVDAGDDASLAADIALLLTERGLGGNDVDLAHRLDELRRDRSRRAQDARAMAKRWAEVARTNTEGVIAKEIQHDGRAPSPREPVRAVGRVGVGGGATTHNRASGNAAPPTPAPSPPFAARMGGGERRGPSRGGERDRRALDD